MNDDHKSSRPHPSRPHALRGYLFIGAAALLWGISAALGRAVFTGKLRLGSGRLQAVDLHNIDLHPIDPLILSQSRTTFSLLVLLSLLLAGRGWQRMKLPARDLAQCFLLGTLGVAASNYFYYLAIQRTGVATAIIVQYTAPVWVLLYVIARGQQRASLQKIAAVALALIGITLVIDIFSARSGSLLRLDVYGIGAALLAAFSFAFYNVAGHRILARYDRWQVLVWTLAAAAVFWLVVNPPWKIIAAHYVPMQWLFLFVFSMISVLGAFSLYFLGLQHLEPTRAIVASCLEPAFSILLAALFLGEVMRPIQVVGIVCVLAAIVIVQRPEGNEQPVVVEPIE
jgi:drug/metabolite transporter, DME family